uniref:Uncharacterized protein n=1 Tax=Glossina brevipalpis TaxID=37001 RepID=A0A1A9W4U2_9MUSC
MCYISAQITKRYLFVEVYCTYIHVIINMKELFYIRFTYKEISNEMTYVAYFMTSSKMSKERNAVVITRILKLFQPCFYIYGNKEKYDFMEIKITGDIYIITNFQ